MRTYEQLMIGSDHRLDHSTRRAAAEQLSGHPMSETSLREIRGRPNRQAFDSPMEPHTSAVSGERRRESGAECGIFRGLSQKFRRNPLPICTTRP
jgi:hypothetical protein